MSRCDVAIVGGSVTGLMTALLFAAREASVVVIETQRVAARPGGALELRTLAITPASRRLFEYVGAWRGIDVERVGHFDSMSVWDAGSKGAINFPADPLRQLPMGWIVEQGNLRAALQAQAERQARIRFHRGRVHRLQAGSSPGLWLDDGSLLEASLVVGADGAQSSVRDLAGFEWRQSAYGQRALIANVTTARPHGYTARQRFVETGPLAFLPLPDQHACSVVWSTELEVARELESLTDDAFMRALGEAFEYRLGEILSTTPRAGFELSRARASRFVQHQVVLVGDAAHVIHPLAGQGLNLGLQDAAALVECCGTPGKLAWPRARDLRRYERWRESELADLRAITDGFRHLFSHRAAGLSGIRGLGMGLTDRCVPLKHWLCARAMGEVGDVPRSARVVRATAAESHGNEP